MVVPDRVVQAQRLVAAAPLVAGPGVLVDDEASARRAGAAGRRARCRPGRRRRPARRAGSCVPELARLPLAALRPGLAVACSRRARRPSAGASPLRLLVALELVERGEQRPAPPSSVSRSRPRPRPDRGLELIQAVVTPSASSGGSAVREAARVGRRRGSRSSRSATPSRPSTVVRFQVNATRSRQKLVGGEHPGRPRRRRAPRSAASKSASQASTRCCGPVPARCPLRCRPGSGSWLSPSPTLCEPAHTADAGPRKGCSGLQPRRHEGARRGRRGRARTRDRTRDAVLAGSLDRAAVGARARDRGAPGAGCAAERRSTPAVRPSVAPLAEADLERRRTTSGLAPRSCPTLTAGARLGRRRRPAGRRHRHRGPGAVARRHAAAYGGWPTGSASSAGPPGPRPTSAPTRSAPPWSLGEPVQIRGAEHYVESAHPLGLRRGAAASTRGPARTLGRRRRQRAVAGRCTRPSSALVDARRPAERAGGAWPSTARRSTGCAASPPRWSRG